MPISCCYGCTPPKRTPYCHGSCPDYIGEVEENKQKKAAEDQKRMVSNAIYYSRCVKVNSAMRRRRNRKS